MKANDSVLRTGVVLGLAILSTLSAAGPAGAETLDFGGAPERFRAGGDKTPPQCQITYPTTTKENFFIQWNCEDRISDQTEIISELWVQRANATRYRKIDDFLGFPASVEITPGILEAETIEAGLPASFRLIARDRAGVAAMSVPLTVVAQDNSVDECDLSIATPETQSTGNTTGRPAMSVELADVAVLTSQSANNNVTIQTVQKTEANPCEIDSVCDDDSEISFIATVTLDSSNNASGTINASPGNVISRATGTATFNSDKLSTIELSGTALIDGATAQVRLSCQAS